MQVLDEADRLLNLDFEAEIDEILKVIPKDRKTYLFSATMTSKVGPISNVSFYSNFVVGTYFLNHCFC